MISSAIDGNKPVWFVTQRHLDRCADCSDFLTLCQAMGRRLKGDCRLLDGIAPEDLHERVLRDVTVSRDARTGVRIGLRAALAAAACILLLALPSVVYFLRRPRVTPPTQYELAAAAVRDIYESGTLLAGGLTRDDVRLSSISNNPLENELQNLTADTESALRFVIANVAITPSRPQLPN